MIHHTYDMQTYKYISIYIYIYTRIYCMCAYIYIYMSCMYVCISLSLSISIYLSIYIYICIRPGREAAAQAARGPLVMQVQILHQTIMLIVIFNEVGNHM